jgi:hypothetical protein
MGTRDDETAKKLAEAFKRGDMKNVRSLRRNSEPDATSWCAGRGWWLSTAEILSTCLNTKTPYENQHEKTITKNQYEKI